MLRFHGGAGRQRLVEALMGHPLLSGNLGASTAICRYLRLLELPANHQITTQGGQDNDLYFIISGSARVLVNGREVASRHTGEHIGEMALLDRTAVRSATVITTEPSVIGKIAEPDFSRVANRHPALWRKLAITLSERLRQRNRFHPAPRTIPVVFVGSSSESLPVAQALYRSLSHKKTEPRLWVDGVFQCTRATIEDLMSVAAQTDFAILVLSPDDVTVSRGKKKASPRDNVIFELGLFMGALSRDRTYIVAPHPLDIKMPTDLLGVTLLTYERRRGQSLAQAMRPVKSTLSALIAKHGPK
jgi:CRP/FNR family transcriptional regulator, cyclic AMP receptor protein